MMVVKELLAEVINRPTLLNWLKYFSATTWNRIEVLKKIKSRISETTITENLIFEFNSLEGHLPIQIFLSKDEKANGNDLEIFIETTPGFIFLPCQAKIIKKNYKYSSIAHKVGNREQIDLLLDYAEKKGGIAAYLLYNYSDHFFLNEELQDKIAFPIESFGCSIAAASFLKSIYHNKRIRNNQRTWQIPSFYELHPGNAMPFHYLGYLDTSKWFPFSQILKESKSIKFYTSEEIENDVAWKELIESAAIGKINLEYSEIASKSQQNKFNRPIFNPKFRLVFSLKRKRGGLYSVS